MSRLCANLSMLFTEVEFLDRFAAAGRAGFTAVECHFPYDYDKDALAARLHEHGLTQVLHNLPAGDWDAGERGIACHPGRHEPGSGEINFLFLLGYIDALGYDGWIGCEYAPARDTVESLEWARPHLGDPSGRP